MSLNLKFVRGAEIRKAHLVPETIAELSACIESIFGSTDFQITYLDAEGDKVTVLTQLDLESAYKAAVAEKRFGLKLFLEPKPAEEDYITQSAQVAESEEDEPEVKEAEVLVFEAIPEPLANEPTEAVEVEIEMAAPQAIEEEFVVQSVEQTIPEIEQTTPEVEQPKAEEEEKELPNIRKCGLRKAMKNAAKHFKDAFKPICKNFRGFKGCKPQVVPQAAPEAPAAQLFTEEQIAFVRNLIREEAGLNKPVHFRYTCDGCGAHPIVGVRYNCTVCRNYDFCETCESNSDHPHPFIKHRTSAKPRAKPQTNEVVVDLNLGNVLPFIPEQLREVVAEIQSKLSERLAPKNAESEGQENRKCRKGPRGQKSPKGLRKTKGLKGKAIAHLTLTKFTEVTAETEYNKVWVFVNKGKTVWPVGSKLVQIRGELESQAVELPPLAPGESFEVSVIVKTPSNVGKAKGVWVMETPEGQHFGEAKCIVLVTAPVSLETERTEATEAKSEEHVVLENLPEEQVESVFVQARRDSVEAKPAFSQNVQNLINMGFSPESAAIALETANSDFDLAISMLLAQS